MWKVVHGARYAGLLIPALLLIFFSVPRFQSGLAIDAAYPVPTLMVVEAQLPQSSYRDTAAVLAQAHQDDGETLIRRAEALSLAQPEASDVVGYLQDGLGRSPASVRGWALLAEHLASTDRPKAAQALGQSLLLGPYDYFVAYRRARIAALLWDALEPETQTAALRQTRLLWTDERLNQSILRVLESPGGSELLARAFRDQPEELRAINRWARAARRNAGS